ncbi:hypothetical protein [Sinorhizobium meliloti]|nr:hypothetical protein [Sinorhizobium meliloti]
MPEKTDILALISHMIALAILLPIGWYLHSVRLFGFGDWVVSLFH